MSAIEQEIIDKFRLMDKEAKQRVLLHLNEQSSQEFDFETWWRDVEAFQAEYRAKHGNTPVGVVELLREIRNGED